MKLNLSKEIHKLIDLGEEKTQELLGEDLNVTDYLDPARYGLDPLFTYKITGGSTFSGTPARKYVSSYNPVKERIAGRKKSLRVVGKKITSAFAVLDIKAEKRNVKSPVSN